MFPIPSVSPDYATGIIDDTTLKSAIGLQQKEVYERLGLPAYAGPREQSYVMGTKKTGLTQPSGDAGPNPRPGRVYRSRAVRCTPRARRQRPRLVRCWAGYFVLNANCTLLVSNIPMGVG